MLSLVVLFMMLDTGKPAARQDIAIEKKHEIDAVVAIARTYGEKIGFESTGELEGETPEGVGKALLDLRLKGATLEEALNAFVRKAPSYTWERVQKGIVNVGPAAGASPLLDARIAHFAVKDANLMQIERALREAPETAEALKTSGAQIRNFYTIVGQVPPEMRPGSISVTLDGMTVREILNELLRRGEASSWSLLPYSSGQSISLRLAVGQ